MGHLVNPVSFRLGVSRYWNSRWVTYKSYRYSFLFKSDWNLHTYLMRLFARKESIGSSFIFSHLVSVRSHNSSFCFIYFWDGKTLESLYFLLKGLLKRFRRISIVNRFLLTINFLKRYYFLKFSLDRFLFFKFYMTTVALFSLRKIFSIFLLYLFSAKSKIFLSNFNYFYKFLKFFLCYSFIKQKFLSLSLVCFSFFKVVTLRDSLAMKFFLFSSNFKASFFFLDYIFSNFSEFFIHKRSRIANFYFVIEHLLKRFVSGLNYSNFKIFLRPMTKLDLTSEFLGRYLSIRMQQRYRLMQALSPVFRDLKKNPIMGGYRIACSGRFTKKEIASYEWFRFGSVPTSTLSARLDFATVPFVLKYSMCCFKVWLNQKHEIFNIYIYLYSDLLTNRDISFSSETSIIKNFTQFSFSYKKKLRLPFYQKFSWNSILKTLLLSRQSLIFSHVYFFSIIFRKFLFNKVSLAVNNHRPSLNSLFFRLCKNIKPFRLSNTFLPNPTLRNNKNSISFRVSNMALFRTRRYHN